MPAVPRNIGLPWRFCSRGSSSNQAGPYGAFLGNGFDPFWMDFTGKGTTIVPKLNAGQKEDVLDRVQERLDQRPDAMIVRRSTVEHPFGTIKAWMGATHFKMKRLQHVATEMALHVLAYNIKRVIAILGVPALIEAIAALLLLLMTAIKPRRPPRTPKGLMCANFA